MTKEELKNLLGEYWFDNKYFEEKAKEVELINQLIKMRKASEVIKKTKKYDELEMMKILEKKNKIETLFQNLFQPYKTLMYLKYISFLTFDQIADKMNYSTKRVYQLHGEALNKLLLSINNSDKTLAQISKD